MRVPGLGLLLLGVALTGCGGTVDEGPEVRVLSTSLGMDCMPVHGADTIGIHLRVAYANRTHESKVWTIASARLDMSGNGEEGTLEPTFFPSGSGLVLPGEMLEFEHVKPPGVGGNTSTCAFCDAETGRWELYVEWSSSQGTFVRRAGSGQLYCTS